LSIHYGFHKQMIATENIVGNLPVNYQLKISLLFVILSAKSVKRIEAAGHDHVTSNGHNVTSNGRHVTSNNHTTSNGVGKLRAWGGRTRTVCIIIG
jgi:hypothetical protein